MSTKADPVMQGLEKALLENRTQKKYWVCFQLLEKILGATTFPAEVRERLDTVNIGGIPDAYLALWEAGIQGILTLNLDQFAVRSHSAIFPGGYLDRFVGDASKRLIAVLQRNRRFVGNLHGVVDDSSTWIFTSDKLKILLDDPGYRQFILSCFTTRTILFAGISVDDIAIEAHLKALDAAGVEGISHFWLTSRTDNDTDGWSERFGIRVIRYEAPNNDHSQALDALKGLRSSTQLTDLEIPNPVLFSNTTSLAELPPPDSLLGYKLDDIRGMLNSYATSLFDGIAGAGGYQAYDEFSKRYDEVIDRAWYVSTVPPKNSLFGYQLIRKAGQGSFGDVYEAVSAEGVRVAVKLLRRDVRENAGMLQTFRRGIRSMMILKKHQLKGMVEFLDASEIPAFVVMEWIDGPDLAEAVSARVFSDWSAILELSVQLSGIVRRAHMLPEGVLHRDIRPPNVMLKDYWTNGNEIDVVVMDFDLSWHVNALEKSIIAKPLGFMAPEQLQPRPNESTRSALVDSFGLGMTLFHVLTSEIPLPNHQLQKSWEDTLRIKIAGKRCSQWKSLPARYARAIYGATRDQQKLRWDFSRLVTEFETLKEIYQGDLSRASADYYCDEIAMNSEAMLNYLWDDEISAALYKSNGLEIQLRSDAEKALVALTIEWRQTGQEDWKALPKTGAQVAERAKPALERNGWSGALFEGSYGFMRVSANYLLDDQSFNAAKLARGVDFLVGAMLPKN